MGRFALRMARGPPILHSMLACCGVVEEYNADEDSYGGRFSNGPVWVEDVAGMTTHGHVGPLPLRLARLIRVD